MKILSVFDGMACGMVAMIQAGVDVEKYIAFEIDEYAKKTATHNFPIIEERGDVFKADFTEFKGFDFLIGGSPCTYWSIAQTKNRETVASGMGWELFCQYVRALHEAQPKYFIYENNKSMSKEIRKSISDAFGFEPIHINSALVSAQNRNRLYWVGIRQADGTYRKADIEQPEDMNILLKDELDGNSLALRDKGHAVIASAGRTTEREYFVKSQGNMVAEPICTTEDGKCHTIKAQYYKNGIANFITNDGFSATAVAEPIRIGTMPSPDGTIKNGQGMRVYSVDGKSVPITTGKTKTGFYAEPINTTSDGKSKTIIAGYGAKQGLKNIIGATGFGSTGVAEPVCLRYERTEDAKRCRKQYENHEIHHGYHELHELHPRPDGKSNTLTTVQKDNLIAEPIYAITSLPSDKRERIHQKFLEQQNNVEIIDISEMKDVYLVENGMITVKDKKYPIKLVDGYYRIRKLSVDECKRLQTVPGWYEFPVSNTQAYKMLGNGWTVNVIVHLIKGALAESVADLYEQISMDL